MSLASALALTIGCKPPTPSEQMDSILSWTATAVLAGQAWLNHTTPDKYSRQTLELADETIRQTSDQLLQSALPSGIDSASVDSLLSRTSARIAQMARFVQAKDAPDFSRQLDSLRADERIVKSLADSLASKQ